MKRRSILMTAVFGLVAGKRGATAAEPEKLHTEMVVVKAPPVVRDHMSISISGSGPDVILIPGLNCGRDVWGAAIDGLVASHRVHLVQVAGFAGEDARANAGGAVVAATAEDLAGYIADQRLEKPAIVGHSMGGIIALMVAARHPDAPGRIMVVDMVPFLAMLMLGPDVTAERAHMRAAGIVAGIEAGDTATYRKFMSDNLDKMILTASARPPVVHDGEASDRHVAARAMGELTETDLRPELPHVTVPTTVLYAWNDTMPFKAEESDRFMAETYQGLGGVKLVRVDASGHFIFLDQPQRFRAELDTFLKG